MNQEYKKLASMAVSKLKVILFLGSVREGRLGLRVARFMQNYLENTGHEVDLFDPLEMNFPLLTKPVHFYGPERKGAPEWLVAAEKKIRAADGYVIVTAEYNHSIPPALSNMLDHFPGSAFSWKPSAIVCYSPGIYGGMRSAIQLRALTAEIGCISVSNIFGIPKVKDALDEDGKPLNDHMEKGAKNLITQFDWMATAMKTKRETDGIPS